MSQLLQPTTQPPLPSATSVLDDLFTLCRIPFVHDFIFNPDPSADISVLTSPAQLKHTISAHITVTGTETTTSYAHVFDFSCSINFSSTPAFSVGAITVGFCTQEPAGDAAHAALNSLTVGAERVQCSRFVRDDERGIFFMLAENAATGVTAVDCSTHNTSRRRTHICARFDTAALRACLRTSRGTLNPPDVQQALSYLNLSYESRACPVCGGPTGSVCDCRLPFVRPAHPHDFRCERRNMSLHTGRYSGSSTIRLFNASQPFVLANLASTATIRGNALRRDVIKRLNCFAVQSHMQKMSVSPLTLMPTPSLPLLPGVLVEKCEPDVNMTPREEPLDAAIDADCTELDFSTTPFQDDGMLPMDGLKRIDAFPPTPMLSSGGLLDGISLQVGCENGVVEILTPSDESTANSQANSGSSTSASGHANGSAVLQAGQAQPVRTTGETENPAFHTLTERERKSELRKQRNREAAAKSNIKRKLRNEALRRDLREVNEKASELRAIEQKLREENVQLRSLATEKNIKVSSHLSHIQFVKS